MDERKEETQDPTNQADAGDTGAEPSAAPESAGSADNPPTAGADEEQARPAGDGDASAGGEVTNSGEGSADKPEEETPNQPSE